MRLDGAYSSNNDFWEAHEGGQEKNEGEVDEDHDAKTYKIAMKKLKVVSIVSIFFIIC